MSKARSQLRFPSTKALCNWLRQTADGKAVLAEVTAKPKRKPRTPMLVVLHSDGWVECFAIKGTADVKIVHRIHITDAEDAVAAEVYTGRLAGKKHEPLYWLPNRVAEGVCKRVTAEDEREWLAYRRVLRAVRGLREHEGDE